MADSNRKDVLLTVPQAATLLLKLWRENVRKAAMSGWRGGRSGVSARELDRVARETPVLKSLLNSSGMSSEQACRVMFGA
jgi:hypothetical protein